MKVFKIPYRRISYGVAIIHAKDKKEALEKVEEREFFDEWDNESEYVFQKKELVQSGEFEVEK